MKSFPLIPELLKVAELEF